MAPRLCVWCGSLQHKSSTGYSALSFPLHTLYIRYTFSYNTDNCHLQKFSDDTAIVARVTEGNDLEYRKVIISFVAWCKLNHLCINSSKTKQVVIDFRRKAPKTAPVNIQGLDIVIVEEYKYLGIHINNRLDWTQYRCPVQEGPMSSPSAEETEVLWCEQVTVKNLLWLCGSISDLLRCGLLGLWKLREGQEETQRAGEKGWLSLFLFLI